MSDIVQMLRDSCSSVNSIMLTTAADEIERLRTLLSEAEKREKDARAKALEEAAKVADEAAEMRERLFKENGGSINASKSAQALIIAANIRQLQSEER